MDDLEDFVDSLKPTPSDNPSRQAAAARRNGRKLGKALLAAANEIPAWKRQLISYRRMQTIKKNRHRLP